MKNVNGMNKKAGFSLLELVVVIVIMGILAFAVNSNMFGFAKDASVANEKSTITSLQTVVNSAWGQNKGTISSITATNASFYDVSRINKDLNYRIASIVDVDTNKSFTYVVATPVTGTDDKGKEKIKKMVLELDRDFDGSEEGSESGTTGNFLYNLTCTSTTGQSDCYYSFVLRNDKFITSSDDFVDAFVAPDYGDLTPDYNSTDDSETSIIIGR